MSDAPLTIRLLREVRYEGQVHPAGQELTMSFAKAATYIDRVTAAPVISIDFVERTLPKKWMSFKEALVFYQASSARSVLSANGYETEAQDDASRLSRVSRFLAREVSTEPNWFHFWAKQPRYPNARRVRQMVFRDQWSSYGEPRTRYAEPDLIPFKQRFPAALRRFGVFLGTYQLLDDLSNGELFAQGVRPDDLLDMTYGDIPPALWRQDIWIDSQQDRMFEVGLNRSEFGRRLWSNLQLGVLAQSTLHITEPRGRPNRSDWAYSEFRRKVKNGEPISNTLRAEAEALADSYRKKFRHRKPLHPKTIENRIRGEYNLYKSNH